MSAVLLAKYFLSIPIPKSLKMKTEIPKTKARALSNNPELTIWLLRIGLVTLYVVLYIFKKKLYL